MIPALLALALLLLPQTAPPAPADLAQLADQARWDELIAAADERLERDPLDNVALYWKGRATAQSAEPLLTGRNFARDLGRTMLRRAQELLSQVHESPGDETADAREWLSWSRYLGGPEEDPELAADLERWFAAEQHGYAAYLRGRIAGDRGDGDAAEWLGRAAAAARSRPEFGLAWAEALARSGQRSEALAAWEQARGDGAALPGLLAGLLSILPDEAGAGARLERLDALADAGGAEDALLQWHRAHALEQLGRLADAEAALARASTGRTPDVERAQARLLRRLQRPAEAAARLLPGARAGHDPSLQDLVSLADELALARRWDEALALYDEALGIEPNEERAARNRALTLSQSGRSLEGYDALVERHPERADVLNDAALAQRGWGRREQARALLERASRLPGGIDARENLARLLLDDDPPGGARATQLLDEVLAADTGRDRALYLRVMASRAAPR